MHDKNKFQIGANTSIKSMIKSNNNSNISWEKEWKQSKNNKNVAFAIKWALLAIYLDISKPSITITK